MVRKRIVRILRLLVYAVLPCLVERAGAQSFLPYHYDIGTPTVTEIFVDPLHGSDGASGSTRATALRTVVEAWSRIPSSQSLVTGYRIQLLPGTYGDEPGELPNYWELKRGTFQAPIIIQAADGQGSVSFTSDINMANVSYVYLLNLSVVRGGDVFHCEACDHILLRGNTFIGAPMGRTVAPAAHETVKVNQSQYVYIENNFIRGAEDNAIDWVAVQHGHIIGNKISDAQGWCLYVKGGSSYIRIESNELFECFEGGVTAGQGTGLEFMVAPWTRHEAYDVKIFNNVIREVFGAALGVNGGYNILLAHNTAYRVGARSHLIEVVFGERSCDGDATACAQRVAASGWGPVAPSNASQPIGNRRIKVFNNLVYNPPDQSVNDQHFAVYGPRVPSVGWIPSPQRSDEDLEVSGNLIWSGPATHPLGIEGADQGCQSSHPTCNATALRNLNYINSVEPGLIAPEQGDLRPLDAGSLSSLTGALLSAFPPRGGDEQTPEGELLNDFTRDFSGVSFSALRIGAFASQNSSRTPPAARDGSGTPGDPGAPFIRAVKLKVVREGSRLLLQVRVAASDDGQITRVTARTARGKVTALKRRGKGSYVGLLRIRSRRGITVIVMATDDNRNVTTVSKAL
jgi:hypothetical protein